MTFTQPDLFGGETTVVIEPKMPEALRRDVEGLIRIHGFDKVEKAVGQWKIEHSGPVASAPARDADPRTSQASGRKMSDVRKFGAGSNSGKLLREFAIAGGTGLTDYAATTLVVGPMVPVTRFEGCRRRCSDLRAAGYIEDTGREEEGRIVWTITVAGENAVDRMHMTGVSR